MVAAMNRHLGQNGHTYTAPDAKRRASFDRADDTMRQTWDIELGSVLSGACHLRAAVDTALCSSDIGSRFRHDAAFIGYVCQPGAAVCRRRPVTPPAR